ncbi:MAG: membrane protein insertase YidC [Draconibacterium sp.]|nr:MAG: membrane protein insertase YidC [Draconibacterium sp.]PIF05936.1 MAG: membrane protein insertase YidC [Draconibacterium sp.]
MDKKSITGIVLIFAILVVFSIINKPSKQQIEAAKHQKDSIAKVEAERNAILQQQANEENISSQPVATPATDSASMARELKEKSDQYGVFGKAASGNEAFYVVENNLMKITFSSQGGRIYSVELKDYQTHDSLPLILFDGPQTEFSLNFFSQNRSIKTQDLFFTANTSDNDIVVSGPKVKKGSEGKLKFNAETPGETKSIAFRLQVAPDKYLEYVYTMQYNSYIIDFDIRLQGMEQYIASNQSYLNFTWAIEVPRQEKISKYGEDRYTNVVYKYFEDDVDNLSQSKSEDKELSTKVKWIGFKQLFFNSTIIADKSFSNAEIKQEKYKDNTDYLANFYTDIALPYNGNRDETLGMEFYFGPNHYQTLRQYKIELERQVYLGYPVVRWVNMYLVIPIFNFLRKYINNFGIIILLLTVFIKMLLFPFTYKSYMSQAKMRALKPEVDELNAKFSKDQAMEKQQAVMALYRKAGVNPMGGCLPMLLQFPILIAMFFFFPTSIELRQQSFLWAHDLSTYDSILKLPFNIPMYGNHVSLFCLLMTITTVISTSLNQQATTGQTMPGMKTMMYIMPVMFLFILNNYSAGLSYYYLLANLITIGQTYIIRGFVDEDKIHQQLLANKKKPVKRSNFQKRLEEMAKQRGIQQPRKK